MNRSLPTVVLALLVAGCARFESKPLSPAQTAAAFNSRSLDSPDLRHFIETNQHRKLDEWPARSWDFSTLTLVAFYYHPSLDVARAQRAVAVAGTRTAGGRPNPVLSVTPGYSSNPADGISPWFPMVSIDVPIETAGKRRKRIVHAGDLAESARLNVYTVAWQVRAQLRTVLSDWNSARQRAELLQRELSIQEDLVRLLEQRRNAGAIAAAEVTPYRIARLRLGAELETANRQTASARVRLGEALGVPAASVASLTLTPDPPTPPGSAEVLRSTESRNRALQSRPDVLAALAEYAAAESALDLEIARQYPDLHLSPGYQFDQGEHKWSIGLSMELPLLNRNQGPIAEAEARRGEAAARFLAIQARVIAELDRSAAAYATTEAQLQSSERVWETERHQAASMETAFRAGGADRVEVDSARLSAVVAESAVVDARISVQQALAQLEDSLQIPFEALESVEQGRADQARSETIP